MHWHTTANQPESRFLNETKKKEQFQNHFVNPQEARGIIPVPSLLQCEMQLIAYISLKNNNKAIKPVYNQILNQQQQQKLKRTIKQFEII